MPVAIRTVDLGRPLAPLEGLARYAVCRVFVFQERHLLGSVDIDNHGQTVSRARLRDAIAEQLGWRLLHLWETAGQAVNIPALVREVVPGPYAPSEPGLADGVSVSVVLATYDRPDQLDQTLKALRKQETSRPFEILVVDNHPDSGLTPPVVARHPGVSLVSEPRQGLAYARNAGFIHSSGDILVATDDDVTMPSDWLETLLAPFERTDVAAVTGNVLPLELETESQFLFEAYGGLGRGFDPIEADPAWLMRNRRRAAPTWRLGATANAAFRAEALRDPRVGLMDEALGPGMPSGVGEDTYLFYKIIRAGFALVYVPDAYVWHTHRRDPEALRRQIYNYSKGHVAYHLTTLLNDGDRRALFRLSFELPRAYVSRIARRLTGRSKYPVSLILLEIWGNMIGPVALWRSRRRVAREGRCRFPAKDIEHLSRGKQRV